MTLALLPLGAALAAATPPPPKTGATITVTVTELRNAKGVVRACMTTDEDQFPRCRGVPGAAWPPCPALRSMLATLGSSPTSLRKSVKRSSSRTSCPRSASYLAASRSRASASGARSSTFCSVRLAPCWEMGLELMEERRSAAYVSGDSLTPRTSRHCATSGVMGSAMPHGGCGAAVNGRRALAPRRSLGATEAAAVTRFSPLAAFEQASRVVGPT